MRTTKQTKTPAKGIVGFVLALVVLTGTSIYLVIARVGPAGWLVAKQAEWFDGKYYPKV